MGRRIFTTVVVVSVGLSLVLWAALADLRWFEHHALMAYCNTNPRISTWTTPLRIVAALLGLVLLWLAPRVGRWAQSRSVAQIVGAVLTVLVPVLLSLVATEIIVRKAGLAAPPSLAAYLPPMHSDENDWYVNTPSSKKDVTTHGRVVHYFVDARGDRAPDDHTQPDPDPPTIVLAGESMAFGYGLPYEQTTAAQLAKALGVQVVNVAGTGFANDQALDRLKTALSWLKHPIATVTFVVAEEMHRNVRNTSARFALVDGELKLIPRPRAWYTRSALWRVLDRVSPLHTDESIGLTRAILQETVRASEAHGARALFVVTNYGPACLDDEQGTPALVRELFEGVGGQRVLAPIPEDERMGDTDMHPNEAGARRLMEAILALMPAAMPAARESSN